MLRLFASVALLVCITACAAQKAPEGFADTTLPSTLPPADATPEEQAAAASLKILEEQLLPGDFSYYRNTKQRALETGKLGLALEWQNPDSGNAGSTKPLRNLQMEEAACREYLQEFKITGNAQIQKAIACREPNGNWQDR